ncbi:MAG: 4-alpha-glucanotransferase [Myxococcota bacterium]
MLQTGRVSGILLPLFSVRSRTDFGIGDFGALDGLFAWMQAAKQRLLMLLPLLPTASGDTSPYATRSAFGLNALFIDVAAMPEFIEAGGVAGLSDQERAMLDEARASTRIRYDLVFPLKRAALAKSFAVFEERHWKKGDERAAALQAYVEEQAAWLDTYALYAAISADRNHQAWWEWPEALQERQPAALAEEENRLARAVRFQKWLQWVAEREWQKVRAQAKARGVLLCGDEPFIIGMDSADCWANPTLLRRDARLGVPPDDFSATGQDWGLPYFDFAQMEKDGYAWLRFRAKKAASYYDLRRVDHAVGYFRQWIRDEKTPTGRFIPSGEKEQEALGERNFRLLSQEAGIVAEDLGVIPPFVRHKLAQLGLPGYRVLRWERDEGVYRDPRTFPASSLATTGTHDTETLAEWWETVPAVEREATARGYPELARLTGAPPTNFTPEVHEAMLQAALNARSELCVLPWQDVLGTRERINLPGSMTDANWSYRIDQVVEELLVREETRAAAARLARITEAAGR